MPERSSLFNGVQIGAETTLGTGVAAGKLLNYLSIDADPEIGFNRFRPMGQSVAGTITPGQDSVTAAISGQGTYSELIYPFSSLMGIVTPSVTDTTAQNWVWTPASRTEITPKSYTVEAGGAVRAHKFTAGVFNGLELTFNRTDGVSIGGSMIGQQLQDNITLTATPTALEDKPILPTHIDVFVDSTSGAIGTTKMTRDFNVVWRNNDAFGPIWPLNSANASWATVVGTEPTIQMELTLEADTQGMGLLADARLGSTKFVRVIASAPGATYGFAGSTTATYKLQIDFAGKISAGGTFDDNDGVMVVNWTLDAIYDAGWAKYQTVTLVNKTATL